MSAEVSSTMVLLRQTVRVVSDQVLVGTLVQPRQSGDPLLNTSDVFPNPEHLTTPRFPFQAFAQST